MYFDTAKDKSHNKKSSTRNQLGDTNTTASTSSPSSNKNTAKTDLIQLALYPNDIVWRLHLPIKTIMRMEKSSHTIQKVWVL